MNDLYTTLGVPRDATPNAIRKAYRSRAKKAHPDAGGTAEQFGALVKAHDILSDPGRRAEYDRTGNAQERQADNERNDILACAAGALMAAMQEALKRYSNPLETNILTIAQGNIRSEISEVKKAKLHHEKNMALAIRTAAKFSRTTPGNNELARLFEHQALMIGQTIAKCDQEIAQLKAVSELLAVYKFTPDKPPMPQPATPFGTTFFTLGRGTPL